MEKDKYLDEKKYQDSKNKLKKIAKTLLIVGVITCVLSLILTIIGFISFGSSAMNVDSTNISSSFGKSFISIGIIAGAGFVGTIGFICIIGGGILMLTASRREITAFTTQQVMPIAKEGIEKATPVVSDAIEKISKSVKKRN